MDPQQEEIKKAAVTSILRANCKFTWTIENLEKAFQLGHGDRFYSGSLTLKPKPTYDNANWAMFLKFHRNLQGEMILRLFVFARTGSKPQQVSYKIVVGEPTDSTSLNICGSGAVYGISSRNILSVSSQSELLKHRDQFGNLHVVAYLEVFGEIVLKQVTPLDKLEHPNAVKIAPESINTTLAKFYQNDTYSDVRLRCGEDFYSAHKLVLEQSSTFSKILSSSNLLTQLENSSVEIEISDINGFSLGLILKSLYGVPYEITSEATELLQWLDCAHKYDVQSLLSSCLCKMSEILSDENAADFTIAAYKYRQSDGAVRNYFQSYCRQRKYVLIQNPHFKALYLTNIDAFIY